MTSNILDNDSNYHCGRELTQTEIEMYNHFALAMASIIHWTALSTLRLV